MRGRGVGPAGADGGPGTGERGQTNLDFAFGVSIFMITVIVALTFVPNLISGVGAGLTQSNQVLADRVASNLANGGLGDASRPGQVDQSCLVAFFDRGGTLSGCPVSGTSVEQRVSIDQRSINASVTRGGTLQCFDGSDIVDCGASQPYARPLWGGSEAPSDSDIALARRATSIEGRSVTVEVRIW